MVDICDKLYAGDTPRQEGNRWRLALTLFVTKGGDRMSDYELIVLVIMIVTLAFSIHNGNTKG